MQKKMTRFCIILKWQLKYQFYYFILTKLASISTIDKRLNSELQSTRLIYFSYYDFLEIFLTSLRNQLYDALMVKLLDTSVTYTTAQPLYDA